MSRPPLARSAAAGLALLAGGDPSGTAAEPVSPPAATVNAPTTPAIASGPTTSTGPALSRQSAPPVDAVPPSAQAVAPATEKSPPSSDPNTATENTWPKDFQVTIGLDIGTPSLPAKSYRPYIAFWVENASHQMVRTLGVLGNDSRFVNHLTTWRRAGGAAFALSFITRATRPNGVYSIAWDGRDDDGQPVPQGSYTICVELVREEGRHVTTTAVIACGDVPAMVELAATVESGLSKIEFGPKPAATATAPVRAVEPPKTNLP